MLLVTINSEGDLCAISQLYEQAAVCPAGGYTLSSLLRAQTAHAPPQMTL